MIKTPVVASPDRKRWWIVWTLFFSTACNYASRQSFSVLSPVIAAQYHWHHHDIALVLGAFQVAYAITWLLGGIVLDAIGCRVGLAVAVVWWSLVNIATGFCSSVQAFAVCRFMLGIGEGFNWPGASKVVAELFPAQERGLAVGIFDSGSSVGGALASLIIPMVALVLGWRWGFVAAGSVGFLWLFAWLRVYRPPARESGGADRGALSNAAEAQTSSTVGRWRQLAKQRNLWGVVLGRGLTDPIWWFYVFWLPEYLSDAHGFSLKSIALFAWLPFIAADLGNLTGGWVAGYCIRRGGPVIAVRKWICLVSCVPILAGIPAARVSGPFAALTLICIALWGHAVWSTMGLTLPTDLFPSDVVATVTGLSGFVAGIFGAGFTLLVGALVDRFSYKPAFLMAGLLPAIATLFVLILVRPRTELLSAKPQPLVS